MIKPYGKKVLVELIEKKVEEVGDVKTLKVAEGARRNEPMRGKVLDCFETNAVRIDNIITFKPYGYDQVKDGLMIPEELIIGVDEVELTPTGTNV